MGKINLGRLIVGGLVAGVVMNVLDMATYGFLFASDMKAWAEGLHLDPAAMESGSAIASFVVCDVLLGLVLVWIYAAIRPRFGAGPKTAVYAGLAFFLTIEIATFGFVPMGIFTMAMFFKTSIAALVTWTLSSVAGAAVYKEA